MRRRLRNWLGGPSRAVDDVFQLFAGLEEGDLLCGYIDAVAGFRIASDARIALSCAEAAKAADFNLVAGAQRVHDAVEDRLHDHFAVPSCHVGNSGNFLDQVGLRHKLYIPPEMRPSVKS